MWKEEPNPVALLATRDMGEKSPFLLLADYNY
jgi:hypothetical protein